MTDEHGLSRGTHTPASNEVAGLLQALPHLTGDTKLMAVDAILTNLSSTSPQVASLAAGLIRAFDSQIGEDMMTEIGAYEGSAKWDEGQSLVDCLILTIKVVELEAALAAFGVDVKATTVVDEDQRVWFVEHDGRRYCIAKVGTDGNAESAIVFGRLYAALHPKSAVLVGMAGGLASKVDPGDIVFAQHVYAYDFRKLTVDGKVNRAKTYKVDDAMLREAEDMKIHDPGWFARVSHDLRQLTQALNDEGETHTVPDEAWKPKIHRGDVLAGSSLVEDGSLEEMRLDYHDRVRAIEMEGAGFAAACDEQRLPWLVVRGIADVGDENRDDNWQFGSTYVAARYVRDGLALGLLKLPR